MNTKEILLGLALGVLAAVLVTGCDTGAKPCVTWNPSMTPPQCQACETTPSGETIFVGPLLKASECEGEPTPIVLEPKEELP